jgi:HD-like signal output (HDOD) protein
MSNRPTTPAELVARVRHLISLPDVYLRVRDLVNDPQSSLAEVASVIAHDPGITARLLRLVNSAHFGFRAKVDTVSRAVSILGMRQVQDIVLATSVVQSFAGVDNQVVNVDAYWRKSVRCAVVSHLLAGACKVLERERLFVAGLLREVGHLVMYQQIPELAQEAMRVAGESRQPIHLAERQVLGFDYARVGAELMGEWGLPPSLVEAVRFHLEPGLAQAYPLEAAVVHIASCHVDAGDSGVESNGGRCRVEAGAWQVTGLTPEAVSRALVDAEQRVSGVIELLLPGAGR